MTRIFIMIMPFVVFLYFLLIELKENKNKYEKQMEITKIIFFSFWMLLTFLFTMLISHNIIEPVGKFFNILLNSLAIVWISFLIALFCSVVKRREIEIFKKKLNLRRKK